MQTETVLTGVANLKMAMTNVGSVAAPVVPIVAMFGNWVGGRFTLTQSHMQFQMNGMNAKLQKDTGPAGFALADVTSIAKGKMLILFSSVDVVAGGVEYRFRCGPGTTKTLLEKLRNLCPQAQ